MKMVRRPLLGGMGAAAWRERENMRRRRRKLGRRKVVVTHEAKRQRMGAEQ
jgi:hypothetical protein